MAFELFRPWLSGVPFLPLVDSRFLSVSRFSRCSRGGGRGGLVAGASGFKGDEMAGVWSSVESLGVRRDGVPPRDCVASMLRDVPFKHSNNSRRMNGDLGEVGKAEYRVTRRSLEVVKSRRSCLSIRQFLLSIRIPPCPPPVPLARFWIPQGIMLS